MTDPLPIPPVIGDPKIQMQLVHGIMPMSINEYIVAVTLDRLGLDYSFQVPLGAPGIRGSQAIDFVVWKAGRGLPVFVQGAHWHTINTESEDILKQAAARQAYHTEPVLLMEDETNEFGRARTAVLEKIGL